MNGSIGDWNLAGQVSLWRYLNAPTRYADWHFSADIAGCNSLLHLLKILGAEPATIYRTITLTDPLTVGADRIFGDHGYRIDCPTKLRLVNCPHDPDFTEITYGEGIFVMILGQQSLSMFETALRDLEIGSADFAFGFGDKKSTNSARISFWWWPTAHATNGGGDSPREAHNATIDMHSLTPRPGSA